MDVATYEKLVDMTKSGYGMPNAQSRHDMAETARLGEEIYERSLRRHVETPENIGKIISIEVQTGDYEVNADQLVSVLTLRARHDDPVVFGIRIGYTSVSARGGRIQRRDETT